MKLLRVAASCGIALLLSTSSAWSCSVPVFRFALERWLPDPYTLRIVHAGPLEGVHLDLVEELREQMALFPPRDNDFAPNIQIELVDLANEERARQFSPDDFISLAAAVQQNPQLSVFYPGASQTAPALWSGPLTPENAAALLDSPARREIAANLLRGDAATWVFLESGNPEEDAPRLELLVSYLSQLEETLELPELNPSDLLSTFRETGEQPELDIRFSVVRIAADDPSEAFLRDMLTRSEPDLETEFAGLPKAFPIYGQGRALYALVGGGINEYTIHEACEFLVGPCSCQVKQLNPGTDLLMTAAWEDLGSDPMVLPVEMPPLLSLAGAAEESANAWQEASNQPGDETLAMQNDTPSSVISSQSTDEETHAFMTTDSGSRTSGGGVSAGASPMIRNLLILLAIAAVFSLGGAAYITRAQGARGNR